MSTTIIATIGASLLRFIRHYPYTLTTLLVCLVSFLANILVDLFVSKEFYAEWLALSTTSLAEGRIWTLFTYAFVHAGLLHFIFNMSAALFLSFTLEEALGAKRMWFICFATILLGAILHIWASYIFHIPTPMVGFSGVLFSYLTIWGLALPNHHIAAMVPPGVMRFKTFLVVMTLFTIICGFFNIGMFAHWVHFAGTVIGVVAFKNYPYIADQLADREDKMRPTPYKPMFIELLVLAALTIYTLSSETYKLYFVLTQNLTRPEALALPIPELLSYARNIVIPAFILGFFFRSTLMLSGGLLLLSMLMGSLPATQIWAILDGVLTIALLVFPFHYLYKYRVPKSTKEELYQGCDKEQGCDTNQDRTLRVRTNN